MTAPRLARAGALLIAVAALLDPSWTRMQPVPVDVAIVPAPGSERSSDRLRNELAPEFRVVAPSPTTSAYVAIRAADGALPRLPESGPVFIVDDPAGRDSIVVQSLDVPRVALAGRTIAATVAIDAPKTANGTVNIELRVNGRIAAQEEVPVEPQRAISRTLTFAAPTAGLADVRIDVSAGNARTTAGAAIELLDRPLRALAVDARPSWSSTFVRRALDDDPAFDIAVAARTAADLVARTAGAVALNDPAALENIDAILTGTLELTSQRDVAALEEFARERGGALVVLASAESARALERLTGVAWRHVVRPAAERASSAHGAFSYSEAIVPARLPLGAAALASASNGEPLVIEMPLGEGRVIVDGAIDAWKHRAADGSAFGDFWRGIAAGAALAAVPRASVMMPARARTDEVIEVEAAVRGARAGEPVRVEGTLSAGGASTPVRFWPSAAPGVFTARIAMPSPGTARVQVSLTHRGARHAAERTALVSEVAAAGTTPPGTAETLASVRGGAYVGEDIDALRARLREAFPAHQAPVTVHPMRYAWWLAPFTLLLGYEWRWRRQRGLK